MYDQFQNVLSTGPNVMSNPVVSMGFDAETTTNSPDDHQRSDSKSVLAAGNNDV